jgi:hypothetical protein
MLERSHRCATQGLNRQKGIWVRTSQRFVGDCQSIVFNYGVDGPFWLSPEQRLSKKHNIDNTARTKDGDKTKAELAKDLEAAGVALPRGKHHSKT